MTVSESTEGSMTAIKYHVAISCILHTEVPVFISESCDHSYTSKINVINGVL